MNDRQTSGHFYPIFFHERERAYQYLLEHDIFPGMHYKNNLKYEMWNGE